MSQPPQNGWGQPSGNDPYGQQGAYDPQSGYGQQSGSDQQNSFGQQGGYGQQPGGSAADGSFGQSPSFAPSFGDGQTAAAPAPQKSGGGGRIAIFVCAGCAVLALLLVVVGGGIFWFSGRGDDEAAETTSAEETSAEETTQEETAEDPVTEEEPTTEEATSEEATTEEATSAASSGGQYAIGETFTIGSDGTTVDVTVGEVNWDATEAVLAVPYMENPEPAAGNRYITVPLTLTYHGAEETIGGLLVLPTYVTGGGAEIQTATAIAPDYEGYIATVNDGDTVSFEVVFEIPDADANSGQFTFVTFADFLAEPATVSAV